MDMSTYSSDLSLLCALLNTLVDRSTGVTVDRSRTTLASKVHVDGEERLLGSLDRLPHGNKGLTAVIPSSVCGINAARVVLEGRAVEHLVGSIGSSGVGLDELDNVRSVQECCANVATRLTTVLVVHGIDLSPGVLDTAGFLNTISKGRQCQVGRNNTVIGGTRVVLNFLQEDQVRSAQLVDDLLNNEREVSRLGVEVLSVVVGDGDTLARVLAGEANGRVLGIRALLGLGGSQRKNAIEAKGVGDNTGDFSDVVTELGVVGILGTVEWRANGDGLGVGIYMVSSASISIVVISHTTVKHGQTTMTVQTRDLPVTPDPEITIVVGAADGIGAPNGDELTREALPKVQTVGVGLQLGVHLGNAALSIGHAKDITIIQLGKVLPWRLRRVLANDLGLELIVGRLNDNVSRRGDFCEVDVVIVGPGFHVSDTPSLAAH